MQCVGLIPSLSLTRRHCGRPRTQGDKTGFWGSGNIDYGKVGDDPYAYICTVEPFHGNTVAVYTKANGGRLANATWKRTILDVFADPNEHG